MASRKTVLTHGRLAIRTLRSELARSGTGCGTAVMSFEQAAARLAGGFTRPVDMDSLRKAVRGALGVVALNELANIRDLPGMTGAVSETLRKAWRADVDLASMAGRHLRLGDLAALEAEVLRRLPSGMARPCDIVAKALGRLEHAPRVLGTVEIVGLTELSPCWRPLLRALAGGVEVRWNAGPRHVPEWLFDSGVAVATSAPLSPELSVVSAATSLHEAVEAMRWARDLIASGRAKPGEIAIAAASPSEYDDHFAALDAEANFPFRFVHGRRVLAKRDGQAAAALADILVRGPSQTRIRRLAATTKGSDGLFDGLHERWTRILPEDAQLKTLAAWDRMLASVDDDRWPDGVNIAADVRKAVEPLFSGLDPLKLGEAALSGQALKIWRKGLDDGPASALPFTLETMNVDDSAEACEAVCFMPASALAASPRPFVRLLGLTSRGWPRQASEDPLLPDHILRARDLDPLPVSLADRRDFQTILASTSGEVVLSRPRRDSEGRELGAGPLVPRELAETNLRRNRAPAHAMSQSDRAFARPVEFAATPMARSAAACWADWHSPEITPHDGVVRAGHPLVDEVLGEVQSATSLRKLLRDPISFVWRYALRWKTPQMGGEPITIDPRDFGDLFHHVLERSVETLEQGGGLANATDQELDAAVAAAVAETAREFEAEKAVPPDAVWRRTLAETTRLARDVIRPASESLLDDQSSFAEVVFGKADAEDSNQAPWRPSVPVVIAGTDIAISGAIDRLDLSGDRLVARVKDYKTGSVPKLKKGQTEYVIGGGKELQRCLYSFAVKAHLGAEVQVEASLVFPKEDEVKTLSDADGVLGMVSDYLVSAKSNLLGGLALPGEDAADKYNDFAFALPANAAKAYWARKNAAVKDALGDAAKVWEEQ